jgi:hypothetical protein
MLTKEEKERWVQWAHQHHDNDWSRTVSSDESCFHLFRNTIRQWSKNSKQKLKRIPKNRQKIMAWVAISIKGQIDFHFFRRKMDGPYYVQILRKTSYSGDEKEFQTNFWNKKCLQLLTGPLTVRTLTRLRTYGRFSSDALRRNGHRISMN